MKMKFAVVILFGIFGSISSEVLSTIPQSKNVTVGSEVEFLCGTNDSSLNVIWFHSEDVTATQIREDLPEGGYIMKLQVTALVEYNDSRYSCYLLNGINQLALEEVTLLVQGKLEVFNSIIIYIAQDLFQLLVTYLLLKMTPVQFFYHGQLLTALIMYQ